jgi:peptidoglycan/xylan/chitin deacetylase (PgdA/CDA1 family)
MYHRVIDNNIDPWDIAVSPKNFEEHLKVLKDYNVIPLSTLETILTKKKYIPRKTVAITFDDGYIDNYVNAKPLLEKHQLPASFFIATEAIEKQQEYWWDTLERICLQTKPLPEQLILDYPEKISWKIKSTDQTNIDSLDPLTLYFKLCDLVRKMPAKEHEVFIESLKTWSSNTKDRTDYLTMRKHELLDLNSNPLFTLGAHTVTHPFLPNFSYDYQKNEIAESVKFLEDLTEDKVKYLAYPHGGNNELTLDIISKLSLKLAFTTDHKCFYRHSHPHTISRFHVKNWDGKTFASELKNWMN